MAPDTLMQAPGVGRGMVRANGIDIHYLRVGEGPLVVCTHGFPDHAESFRHLLPVLARAGFTAVAPYLRGYAPTQAPEDGEYHTAHMAHDLLSLIRALGFERASLVGHDWGAQASIGAAILRPDMIEKLVTIGWGRPDQDQKLDYAYLKGTWHAYFFHSPVAEAAIAHADFAFLEDWWRDSSRRWDIPAELLEGVKSTFRRSGVLQAALAQYRCRLTPSRDASRRAEQDQIAAGPVTVPTLAMHGTHDRERRLEAFQGSGTRSFFTGPYTASVIEGTGHFLHQEKPDEANAHILRFLRSEA